MKMNDFEHLIDKIAGKGAQNSEKCADARQEDSRRLEKAEQCKNENPDHIIVCKGFGIIN